MLPAPLPLHEDARLARLQGLGVLDTLPQQAFDDISALAQAICGTPIALISLVDRERQWFKSRVGLEQSQTSREVAFCAHAILQPTEVMVVPDARQDVRFADNPLVTGDLQLRFYAGAPIVTTDGHAVGTVCVIDQAARELTPAQTDALRRLSRLVSTLMEHEQARREENERSALAAQLRDEQLTALLRLRDAEVEQQNEHLRQTVVQLERKTQEQEHFIQILSHDLREPINTINNFTSLLLDTHSEELPPGAGRYIGFVQAGGQRMRDLLDDLLNYMEVDRHEPRPEPTELGAALREVRSELATTLTRQHAVLEAGPLPSVYADPALLRQVLRNLISNSLKFVAPGVAPQVRVWATDSQGEHQIHVRDNGIGIAADQQDAIFDMFKRLHNRKKYDGSGLGLAICRRIADLHHGRLTLQSTPGQGSCFTLHLPLAPQATQ